LDIARLESRNKEHSERSVSKEVAASIQIADKLQPGVENGISRANVTLSCRNFSFFFPTLWL